MLGFTGFGTIFILGHLFIVRSSLSPIDLSVQFACSTLPTNNVSNYIFAILAPDTGAGTLAPGAPTSAVKEVTYRSVDSKTVTLQWYPPKDTTGDIKSYIVQVQQVDSKGNPIKDPVEYEVESKQTSYDLENLESGAEYEVIVYGANENGRGPGSEPVYASVDKDTKELPRE